YTYPGKYSDLGVAIGKAATSKMLLVACAQHDLYADIFICDTPENILEAPETIDWTPMLNEDNFIIQVGHDEERVVNMAELGWEEAEVVVSHFMDMSRN